MTLHEAAKLVAYLNDRLNRVGWICALYGSTLKHPGRDVDIIIFNKYENPKVIDIIYWLSELGFKQDGEVYKGIFSDGYIFVKEKTILDIQIRIYHDLHVANLE